MNDTQQEVNLVANSNSLLTLPSASSGATYMQRKLILRFYISVFIAFLQEEIKSKFRIWNLGDNISSSKVSMGTSVHIQQSSLAWILIYIINNFKTFTNIYVIGNTYKWIKVELENSVLK